MASEVTYIRQEMLAPLPPPTSEASVVGWVRKIFWQPRRMSS